MASAETGLLTRVNFPLYCVKLLKNNLLLVGGGGGSSNTGITNGMEVFTIVCNGERYMAKPLTKFETGRVAIMNCEIFEQGRFIFLAVGAEADLHLYKVTLKLKRPEDEGLVIDSPTREAASSFVQVRHRRRSSLEVSEDSPNEMKELLQEVEEKKTKTKKPAKRDLGESMYAEFNLVKQVQSECIANDAYLKVVRVNPTNDWLVTGGSDGYLRFWKSDDLEKIKEIQAHSKEIDDIDVSPCGTKIISICKDQTASVWKFEDGSKVCDLLWETKHNACKYHFKRGRFAVIEGHKNKSFLITIHNPLGKPKEPAYVVQWDHEDLKRKRAKALPEVLSALAVSSDGRFFAVGCMFSGSVEIFTTFNLQSVKKIENAHKSFITGLEFAPSKNDACSLTVLHDASLISISVDNQVKVHHIPKLPGVTLWWALSVSTVVLFVTFSALSYFGV
ncbi:unnamed protein product [Darwinula stevensoni]|uniref:Prolactin regulatory element-binding protein n=1 Tax=Darwinula stevensoni TaxID=69355 RepID=A0A7R9A8A5_9CRUS|nr:unnamed protein product [Darwinula stevensoni]CAG0896197.1 unnamed protein product [Darwinula stevensoni]